VYAHKQPKIKCKGPLKAILQPLRVPSLPYIDTLPPAPPPPPPHRVVSEMHWMAANFASLPEWNGAHLLYKSKTRENLELDVSNGRVRMHNESLRVET
jgi:hypothetical protein